MSKYLLDCDTRGDCTMLPYSPPPETVTVYEIAPNWMYGLTAGLLLMLIIAIAVVRFHRHSERGDTERIRLKAAMQTCQTCGAKAVEE